MQQACAAEHGIHTQSRLPHGLLPVPPRRCSICSRNICTISGCDDLSRSRHLLVICQLILIINITACHTVIVRADPNMTKHSATAQIFHAHFTPRSSCLSGQKRSKKNAPPKINATEIPAKMLYEAAPMKSLLWTLTPGCWPWISLC